MPNKTIYVKDEKMWELAKKLAGKEGLSSVISEAIADYVSRRRREEKGFQKYRLEVGEVSDARLLDEDAHDQFVHGSTTGRIKFVGRLLIDFSLDGPSHFEGNQDQQTV